MRIFLTGAGGFIGSHLYDSLAARTDIDLWSTRSPGGNRIELDLEISGRDAALLESIKPDCVIHAAAMSSLKECQDAPDRGRRINTEATIELSDAARNVGARFIFLSTDQVFDGDNAPYSEDDPTSPIHVYGETKQAAEQHLMGDRQERIILRPSLVYGHSPSGTRSASEDILGSLARGETPHLFEDEFRTPVSVECVTHAVMRCLETSEYGIFNLGGADRLSRYDFGLAVCRAFGIDPGPIAPTRKEDLDLEVPRPTDLSLNSERAHKVLNIPSHGVDLELETQARRQA